MSKSSVNDSVHWFMNELTSRVVAESGIPSDRFHMGKIILQSLKDDPDMILQIDGAVDASETSGSVLQRTVKCAVCLRNLGLQKDDVMILMAPNHLDLAIPFYAALYLGISVASIDWTLGLNELQSTFSVDRPKIIFCQSDKAPDVQIALNNLEMNAEIVTFDKGDYLLSFEDFLEKYYDGATVDDFKANNFDPEDTAAFLLATSGTTGLPKAAVLTHKNLVVNTPYLWARSWQFPGPTRLALLGSPLQWVTAIMIYVTSPMLRFPRLVSSQTLTPEMTFNLINKYKPSFSVFSPTSMTTLLKLNNRNQCDFTSFDTIMLAGSAVPPELIDELKRITPKSQILNVYGMTELSSMGFYGTDSPPGSCGRNTGCFLCRIVDVETMTDIEEPNVPGELWMKGPGIFKEYYNNPEATKETFAEDSWFRTGDMFYRDENDNYFFVDRIKLLLKYKSHQISPVEVEAVIRQHPGVFDVAVTGIPDPECGDLVVACVVPQPGVKPTAQEIKDLVKDSLTDSKQLRGGVIFMEALPLTASSKVQRRKLKELAMTLKRE